MTGTVQCQLDGEMIHFVKNYGKYKNVYDKLCLNMS